MQKNIDQDELNRKFGPFFKQFLSVTTRSHDDYLRKSSLFELAHRDSQRYTHTIAQSLTQKYSHMASKFLNTKYQLNDNDDLDSLSTLKTDSGLESVDSRNLLYTELKDYFESGTSNRAIESKYKTNIFMTYDNSGNSIFHLAAKYGKVETLRNLIEKYPDKWYVTNRQGETAMQSAIDNANLDTLKYLIQLKQYEENVQISELCDHEGNSLLCKAIQKNQYEIVKYLIENYKQLLNVKNAHGSYPLHFACMQSNMNIVRLLSRESKKYINTRDNASYTPVMLASYFGQYETLKYLLDNMNGKHGKVTKKEKYNLVHLGVRSGSLDIVQYLIMKCGTSYLKQRTRDGATVYHLAAACGHYKILEYLLAHKIAKDLKYSRDMSGSTAAHDCAEHGHYMCLKLLNDAGLSMFDEDLDKTTPCMLALRSGNYECQQFVKTLKPPTTVVPSSLIMHTKMNTQATSLNDQHKELNSNENKTQTTTTNNKLNLRRITSMMRHKRATKSPNGMPPYLFTQRFRPAPVSLPQFSTMTGLQNNLAQAEDELNDILLDDVMAQTNPKETKIPPQISLSPNVQRKLVDPKALVSKSSEFKSNSEEYLNPRRSYDVPQITREESIYEFNNPINPSNAYKLLNKKKSVVFEDELVKHMDKRQESQQQPKYLKTRFTLRQPNSNRTPRQKTLETNKLKTRSHSDSLDDRVPLNESLKNEPPPDYWDYEQHQQQNQRQTISLAQVIVKSIQEKNLNLNLVLPDDSQKHENNDYSNIINDPCEKSQVTSVSVVASSKSLGSVSMATTTDDDLPPPPSQSFLRRIEIENDELLRKSTVMPASSTLLESECEPVKNELKPIDAQTKQALTTNTSMYKKTSNNLLAEIKKHKLFGTQKDYILRYLDRNVQKYETLFSSNEETSSSSCKNDRCNTSSNERFPFVKNKQYNAMKNRNISVFKVEKGACDSSNCIKSVSCDNVNINHQEEKEAEGEEHNDEVIFKSNFDLKQVYKSSRKFIKANSIDDTVKNQSFVSNHNQTQSARGLDRPSLQNELDLVFKVSLLHNIDKKLNLYALIRKEPYYSIKFQICSQF